MVQRNTRIMFNYSAPLNLTTWDLNEFNMPSKKAKGNQLKNLTSVKLFLEGQNSGYKTVYLSEPNIRISKTIILYGMITS